MQYFHLLSPRAFGAASLNHLLKTIYLFTSFTFHANSKMFHHLRVDVKQAKMPSCNQRTPPWVGPTATALMMPSWLPKSTNYCMVWWVRKKENNKFVLAISHIYRQGPKDKIYGFKDITWIRLVFMILSIMLIVKYQPMHILRSFCNISYSVNWMEAVGGHLHDLVATSA